MRILNLPSNELYHYVLTGKFEAPDCSWTHERFPLGEYELFVMTQGTLYLRYHQENFTIKQGEYLLLPPCNNAWRQGFRPSLCSFYWLHFSPRTTDFPIEQALSAPLDTNHFFTLPQTGTIPKPEKIVVLMKQLQDEAKLKYPTFALDSMATSVMAELYGQLCHNITTGIKTPAQKQIYSDIIDYIEQNLSHNLKISEIASFFGYNEKYLSHLFADLTGVPLKQFIVSRKMDTANFMLTDSNIAISEIAEALGFADSHNFSRAYKAHTGLTPSEYRNAFAGRMLNH